MKTLMLLLYVVAVSIGQRSGAPPQRMPSSPQRPMPRPVSPQRPMPMPRPISPQQIVVRPFVGTGFGYENGYYGNRWGPWGEYPYYNSTVIIEHKDCKTETLKDSNKKKHDILVCRQSDGTYKVIADADKLPSK